MDPRHRYFHGAVDVSTLFPNEPSKYFGDGIYHDLVEAAPRYCFTVRTGPIPDNTPINLGWFPPFLFWDTAAVVVLDDGASVPAAGTITLALAESAAGAADGVTIVPALTAVTSAGPVTTTARYALVEEPRMLVLTPAGITANTDMLLGIIATPTVPIWK